MADTTPLEQVEPFIHTHLSKKFHAAFSRKRVPSVNGEGFLNLAQYPKMDGSLPVSADLQGKQPEKIIP